MRSNLYKLGRYAARRPWVVIGAWLVVAALVIAASGAFGKKLEESFGAPGVDSQSATEMWPCSASINTWSKPASAATFPSLHAASNFSIVSIASVDSVVIGRERRCQTPNR